MRPHGTNINKLCFIYLLNITEPETWSLKSIRRVFVCEKFGDDADKKLVCRRFIYYAKNR